MPDALRRPFHVTDYDARIEPSLSERTLKGTVAIDLVLTAPGQRTIELDSGDLTIDAVKDGKTPVDFEARGMG